MTLDPMDRRKNDVKKKLELVIRAALAERRTMQTNVMLSNRTVIIPWHRETPQRISAMRWLAEHFGYKMATNERPITLAFKDEQHKVYHVLHRFNDAASCAAFLLKTYNERYPHAPD